MHSKLRITFLANASNVGPPSSGGMRIEIHETRIKYITSLRIGTPRDVITKSCLAIERHGVIKCSRTFLCSRQVHKPTVGACGTFVSVNEFCKNNVIIESPSNTPNK